MADNKKYYWLKLPKDFFERKEVKLLRKLENGELYVLIYQKILLSSLETDGEIYFDHLTDTPEEELALSINEEVEDVRNVLKFLLDKQLVTFSEDTYLIEHFATLVGKEANSTERVRAFRERKKQEMLHETENELQETFHETNCNTEKRRDREEIEKNRKEKEEERKKEINNNKDKEQDTKDRIDTEDRVDKTLDEILAENEQLYYEYIKDKTLTEQQKEYIFQQMKRYRKKINDNQLRGFYNHAKQFISDQKGE